MVYLAQNQPPKSNRKRRKIWVDPYSSMGFGGQTTPRDHAAIEVDCRPAAPGDMEKRQHKAANLEEDR
jgi:hypothetical protein